MSHTQAQILFPRPTAPCVTQSEQNEVLGVLLGLCSLTTSNQVGVIRLQDLIHAIIIIIIQFKYCLKRTGSFKFY